MSEQTLQLNVVENSTSAIAALGNLVNALERVKKAVSKGLSLNNAAQQFVSFSSAIEKGVSAKTVSTVERLASACERVKKSSKFDFSGLQNTAKVPELEGIKESMQTIVPSGLEKVAPEMQRVNQVLEETAPAAKEAAEGVKETGKDIKEAAKEAKHSYSALDKLLTSIGRIAFYRAIRSAIKAVTDGFKEGVTNVRKYSEAIGGSFARDMNTAAASLSTMRNSLGAAVAPALQALIPILSTITSFAITAFNALNQLLSLLRGGGSWTRATASMNNYTKAAKGAGGATKDLLADWDELNIIQSQGGGGGGGSDIDYSDMFEEVYEFDSRLKSIVGWLQQHMESLKSIAVAIGAGILGWTVSSRFISSLSDTLTTANKLKALALSGAVMAVTVALVTQFDKKFIRTGDWGQVIADALTSALGGAITGRVLAHTFGKAGGFYGAAVTVALSGAVSLWAAYDGIKEEGLNYKSIVMDLVGIVKGGIAGALVAAGLGASVVAGAAIGIGLSAAVAVVLGAVALDEYSKENAKEKALWGEVTLTADEMKQYAAELFTLDTEATVNLSNVTIGNLESAKTKLKESAKQFNLQLNAIKLGIDNQSTLSEMLNTLTGGATDGTFSDTSLLGSLKNQLGAMKGVIQLGVSILPAYDSEGLPMDGKAILEHAGISESTIMTAASDLGGQLASLLSEGMSKGLDAEQSAMVAKLTFWLDEISSAVLNGQISGKFLGNLQLGLGSLDRQSFVGVMQEYEKQVEAVKQEYEALAVQQQSAMQGLASGMEATYRAYKDLYGLDDDRTKQAAKAWADALGDVLNYNPQETVNAWVDNAKKQAKSAVVEVMKEVYSGQLKEAGVLGEVEKWKSAWENGWDTWAKYGGDLFAPTNIANQLQSKIDEALKASMKKDDWEAFLSAQEIFGVSGWDLLSSDIRDQIVSAIRQAVGDEHAGSVLQELGINNGSVPMMDEIQKSIDDNPVTIPAPDTSSMENGFKGLADSVNGSVNAIIADIGRLNGLRFSFGFSGFGNFGGRIGAAAEGGLFNTGEMFIAREAGPELVGRMGSKNAVANNDQIVSGITYGVAMANGEQNSLLQRIATEIRNQGRRPINVQLNPSAALGRVNAQSERMYECVKG